MSDWNAMRRLACDVANEVLELLIKHQECPECKTWQPMVKITRPGKEYDLERLRCLGCLTVFNEKLIPEEEEK